MAVTELFLGFVLLTLGASALILSAAFWTRGGRVLPAFGCFVLLYGFRWLIASPVLLPEVGLSVRAANYLVWDINYWLPIPSLIYTEQQRGRGWGQSLRRLWQVWIPFAIGLTVWDLVVHQPGALRVMYLPFVIAALLLILAHVVAGPSTSNRRIQSVGAAVFLTAIIQDNLASADLMPWSIRLEPIGVAAFIGSLGFVTGRQFFAREREMAVVEHEMKTARGIQTSILPHGDLMLKDLRVTARYVPMRTIAGDLYDFLVVDDRRVGVLVADVTGHGVPAALIASMVKVAFTAQQTSAAHPGRILAGMNASLCGNLESQLVTATYLYFDTELGELRYSSAGHPPPVLIRPATGEQRELDGGGVLLGFDAKATYPDERLAIRPGDRVLLYTDGLVEARNAAGAYFGDSRFKEVLRLASALPPEQLADALLNAVRTWTGQGSTGGSFEDDLTIVVVELTENTGGDSRFV